MMTWLVKNLWLFRTITFDCPAEGASKLDIHVSIVGSDSMKYLQVIRLNSDGTFNCEFSTSLVGEHTIEIVIRDDASKLESDNFLRDTLGFK